MAKNVEIVRLNEAKELAKTISNRTAQNIIDYVANNKGCTASQIAKGLKLPASTVHYNLKALTEAKIVDDNSFHYSSKGKEVVNYELSKKVIIILPETASKKHPEKTGAFEERKKLLLTQLSALLPGIIVVGATGFGILLSRFFRSRNVFSRGQELFAMENVPLATGTGADAFVATAPQVGDVVSKSLFSNDFFLGLLIGAGILILSFFLYWLFWRRRVKTTIRK